jgi:chitin synthase
MYLAEDRVLSYAILANKGQANILSFQCEAIAFVDTPNTFYKMIMQRRRWINGTWFAYWYTFTNIYTDLRQTKHSCIRKFSILLYLFMLKLIQTIFNWFSPAVYYVYIHAIMRMVSQDLD